MATDIQSLYKAAKSHFKKLQQRVQFRLDPKTSLTWLLVQSSYPPYQPDYLTMSTAGNNRFEQTLNRFFARYFPKLWFRIFWPKVSEGLIAYAEDDYLIKVLQRVDSTIISKDVRKFISSSFKEYLSQNWKDLEHCTFTEISNFIVAILQEPFQQYPEQAAVFQADKRQQNEVCLNLLKQIKQPLKGLENRLEALVYLACRANWIDNLEDDCQKYLEEFESELKSNWIQKDGPRDLPLDSRFYQIEDFKRILNATSRSVLYEADNCGEIVFDLCLVEEIISRGRTVYLCIKGGPVVNDAMEKDVLEVMENDLFSDMKMALLAGKLRIITAGSFVGGGKIAHECSKEYKDAYLESDLVILKGQGNFQAMPLGRPQFCGPIPYAYRNSMVFMTGVKARMIQMCLNAYFPKKIRPPKNSLLLHVYDSNNY